MALWLGSGHASSDVHADDVWLRVNLAWGNKIVWDWRSCVVIQRRTPSPWKANGYHSFVPRVDVVMNLQDKMNELINKMKASAH